MWEPTQGKWPTGIAWAMFIILLIIIIALAGPPSLVRLGDAPEIQMGMVTVLALSVVVVLIYLMAAGFTHYKLSSSEHALGLPDGSIRAMIALFLIVIFVMLSVYLFRQIAGETSAVLRGLSTAQVLELRDRIGSITQRPDSLYDVTIRAAVTPAGEQLGLQLITLLGTLVTAVASFYFGSSAVASAKDTTEKSMLAATTTTTPRAPAPASPSVTITAIDPPRAEAGKNPVLATITGKGFIAGMTAKLAKGTVAFEADNEKVVNATTMECTFDLSAATPGKLNLILAAPGGAEIVKADAFEVTETTEVRPAPSRPEAPT